MKEFKHLLPKTWADQISLGILICLIEASTIVIVKCPAGFSPIVEMLVFASPGLYLALWLGWLMWPIKTRKDIEGLKKKLAEIKVDFQLDIGKVRLWFSKLRLFFTFTSWKSVLWMELKKAEVELQRLRREHFSRYDAGRQPGTV